jgi:DNA-binding transcriptional ArsR family regulator
MSRGRSAAAHKLDDAAPIFAALGDATRVKLVARLSAEGPLSISRLSEGSGVTRQAVTKHLRVMDKAGLLRGSRHGRERIFELEPKRIEKARRYLDMISADWDRAIDRLRSFVETEREE